MRPHASRAGDGQIDAPEAAEPPPAEIIPVKLPEVTLHLFSMPVFLMVPHCSCWRAG